MQLGLFAILHRKFVIPSDPGRRPGGVEESLCQIPRFGSKASLGMTGCRGAETLASCILHLESCILHPEWGQAPGKCTFILTLAVIPCRLGVEWGQALMGGGWCHIKEGW